MTLFDSLYEGAGDYIVLGVFILFAALSVYLGSKKGLMLKLLSLFSVAAAFLVEALIYPHLMEYLEGIDEVRAIYEEIGLRIFSGISGSIPTDISAENGLPSGAASSFHMEQLLSESPLYSFLGLDTLAEEAGRYVGEIACGVVCFILIFILIRVGIKLLVLVAGWLRKIRIIHRLDAAGGAALGFVESIFYTWMAMLLATAFPTADISGIVLRGIFSSKILSFLYANNLILAFFKGMTGISG